MNGDVHRQANDIAVHSRPADEWDASLARALLDAPFTLILTDLDGKVRRVVCPASNVNQDIRTQLVGTHISEIFAADEQRFLQDLISKLSSTSFSLENAPVQLRGEPNAKVYLSASSLTTTGTQSVLFTWHVCGHDRLTPEAGSHSERRLLKRMEVLNSRLQVYRKRVEHANNALSYARSSNRILSHALQSTREFRRQQADMLRQMVEKRDELIQRAQELHASVVEARVDADEARLRLRILADVSWALTELMDAPHALERLSDLLVPVITECLVVDLVDPGTNMLNHAIVACRDKSVTERIQQHPHCRFTDLNDDHPLLSVLSTGHASVLHDLNTGKTTWQDGADTFIDHAGDSGLTSCIIAPLRSRNRTIGTMTLASSQPGHLYRPEDLQFAEDLALRTAQALDNAMLYQDAMHASQERERYLSMASHELRSPLAVVSGFGSLMLRYIESPDLDRDRILSVGYEMQQGIERLEVLTNNLLASAEVEAQTGGLQRRRADIVRIVQDLVDRMRATAPNNEWDRIEFTSDAPVFGRWNLEGIERALTNVISNALKYSSQEDTVTIDVNRKENNAVVSVRDQGIGMTEDELADLFIPFSRGKQARSKAIGSGLGMYITQQIIRQHGGNIKIESAPGEGSLVTITLPLEPSYEDASEEPETIRRIR